MLRWVWFRNNRSGQILISQNVITDHILTNALELQKMVAAGSLIGDRAALVLNMVASGATKFRKFCRRKNRRRSRLLKQFRFINSCNWQDASRRNKSKKL